MTRTPVWILAGVRTPFAKAGSALKRSPVYELGRVATAELLARNGRRMTMRASSDFGWKTAGFRGMDIESCWRTRKLGM